MDAERTDPTPAKKQYATEKIVFASRREVWHVFCIVVLATKFRHQPTDSPTLRTP